MTAAPWGARRKRRSARAFALVAGLALARTGAAVEALADDLRVDVPVIAVTGIAWIASEALFKKQLAPVQCRWCDRDSAGNDTLNAFDAAGRSVRWRSTPTADLLSGVDAFALMPIALLGLDAVGANQAGALRAWPVDAMILVEAVTVNAVLNQAVKFAAGRERPFVHFLPPGEKSLLPGADDNNLSFYSGHTSLAFALAVAAGVVAHQRGYAIEPLIWAIGLPLAASVGYLRVAADKHYATDVLVGAAVGSAIGFALPTLFHSRMPSGSLGFSIGPNGIALSLAFP